MKIFENCLEDYKREQERHSRRFWYSMFKRTELVHAMLNRLKKLIGAEVNKRGGIWCEVAHKIGKDKTYVSQSHFLGFTPGKSMVAILQLEADGSEPFLKELLNYYRFLARFSDTALKADNFENLPF